jgi:hypothetical protein
MTDLVEYAQEDIDNRMIQAADAQVTLDEHRIELEAIDTAFKLSGIQIINANFDANVSLDFSVFFNLLA